MRNCRSKSLTYFIGWCGVLTTLMAYAQLFFSVETCENVVEALCLQVEQRNGQKMARRLLEQMQPVLRTSKLTIPSEFFGSVSDRRIYVPILMPNCKILPLECLRIEGLLGLMIGDFHEPSISDRAKCPLLRQNKMR